MNKQHDLSQRLNAIIEAAIDGIITIDGKGTMLTTNKSVTKLFEYHKDEMIGKNVSMLMPEPYHSSHDKYLDNYVTTRKAKIIGTGREVKGKKKDGTVFPFRLAVSEVILSDRIIFTGIIHDLTETKNAQRELQKLNNQLEDTVAARTNQLEAAINKLIKTNRQLETSEEALTIALKSEKETNELKSRFITIASHEFRTPLSTILSSAALISRYTESEQQLQRNRHIDKIKNSVNHLTGILNDFLDLSKLEEGKVVLKPENLVVVDLIDEIFIELNGILKPGQEFQIFGDKTVVITSDKKTLKNILFNLLSNAIKYSEEGIISVEISSDKQGTILKVKDKGVGIPEKEQKFLFQRFFRASNAENIQGTGLGLSIVKRYVDLLGGSIDFDSQENIGTTFTVVLPNSPHLKQ